MRPEKASRRRQPLEVQIGKQQREGVPGKGTGVLGHRGHRAHVRRKELTGARTWVTMRRVTE